VLCYLLIDSAYILLVSNTQKKSNGNAEDLNSRLAHH